MKLYQALLCGVDRTVAQKFQLHLQVHGVAGG